MDLASKEIINSNTITYLNYVFDNLNIETDICLPSEWASQYRYINEGLSNRFGYVDHSVAPHLVEIMDCFHPYSGISQVFIMKSTQSLVTTSVAENVIGWAIKHSLHNILYLISTAKMGKIRNETAIDTMIDDSGLKDYIRKHSERKKHASAEKENFKQLAGNKRFMVGSYKSIADAKSLMWDFIVMDELDEAGDELKGQGDIEKLFEGRTTTARHAKILKISTPTNTEGRIYKQFLRGDQRYYYMPCPFCGEFQVLEMWDNHNLYGLRAKYEDKDNITSIVPYSVEYVCKYCKKGIGEEYKGDMLNGGEWRPTAKSESKEFRSYHISGLMSPTFSMSWTTIIQRFIETGFGKNSRMLKNFKIDILGQPWELRDERLSPQRLYEMSDSYELGKVPDDAFLLFAGTDIQKNRIECQVLAVGKQLKCYVIDYKVFAAETTTGNENDICWYNFANYINTTEFKWKLNKTIKISRCGVDVGYNPTAELDTGLDKSNAVYKTCHQNPKLIPVTGTGKDLSKYFTEAKPNNGLASKRIDLNSNILKELIFDAVENGKIFFTKKLPEDYFVSFLSEIQIMVDGKKTWKRMRVMNEKIDTFAYAYGIIHYMGINLWTNEQFDAYEAQLLTDI